MKYDVELMRLKRLANDEDMTGEEETAYSNSWPFDPTVIDEEKARKLMRLWAARTLRAARVHYREAIALRNHNLWLTVANAGLSIMILFLTNAGWIQQALGFDLIPARLTTGEPISWYTVLVSTLAMLLVVTTIMQYILRHSERSGEHRRGGAEFSNLHRKIERYCISKTLNMSMVHNINREFNHLTKSYPLIDMKKWATYEKDLSSFIHELEEDMRDDWRQQSGS